jgi:hypothetical protein
VLLTRALSIAFNLQGLKMHQLRLVISLPIVVMVLIIALIICLMYRRR